MVILFALLSAVSYGAADFLGGLSSRNNPALSVVAWSQLLGLAAVLIAAPLFGASGLRLPDLLWGMAAGICGAAGVGILFRGLASGLASVVSPTAAVTGAVLPVLYGLISGERPAALTWIGVALALPAIVLLSIEPAEKNGNIRTSLKYGLLSGIAFSGFFILISQTGEGSGLWPLLGARAVTVPLFFLLCVIRQKGLSLTAGTRGITIVSGVLDMMANIFYLLAIRTGYIILAVVLTALYPAPTVVLQRVHLKEKLTASRIAGLILAIAGAALIGVGG